MTRTDWYVNRYTLNHILFEDVLVFIICAVWSTKNRTMRSLCPTKY